jgi:small subunit ribosomal protein S2
VLPKEEKFMNKNSTRKGQKVTGSKAKTSKRSNKSKKSQKAKSSKRSIQLPSLQELLEAGSHFGHKTSRWNPAMEEYIFDTRADIHIIDLAQTMELLYKAVKGLHKASKKGNILLVGTKGQAATLIKKTGIDHGAFYISKRWPGGLLTNFKSVRKSVDKLMELEEDLAMRRGYKTKKERLVMEREKEGLERLYEGIRFMRDMPSAMVVVDTRVEKNAIREARRLGVEVVGIIDTNCDPDLVDYPVPANDDAIRSIELFINHLIQGFSKSKTSAKLIQKRNNYIDRLNRTRKRAKKAEERRKREKELEIKRLKAMKEGKKLKVDKDGSMTTGKVVRVKKKDKKAEDQDKKKPQKPKKSKKAPKPKDTKKSKAKEKEKEKSTKDKKKAKKKKADKKAQKAKKSVKAKKKESDEKTDKKDGDSVESLELGTRINNALEDADIKTVDELKELSEEELGDIDGIGAVSVEKIQKAV